MGEWTKERHELAVAREKAATKGPWHGGSGYEQSDPGYFVAAPVLIVCAAQGDAPLTKEDRDFIVGARNDAADMLEAIELLKEQRDAWARYCRATMAERKATYAGDTKAEEKAYSDKVAALGHLLHLGIDPHVDPFARPA